MHGKTKFKIIYNTTFYIPPDLQSDRIFILLQNLDFFGPMNLDLNLFLRMLGIDSTSGKEREFACFLEKELPTGKCSVSRFEVGNGTVNLLLGWGEPDIVFCSHLDTVPPYIPPTAEMETEGGNRSAGGTPETLAEAAESGHDLIIKGRGSCDAKGQIFAMYSACRQLEAEGCTGFGLLLLAGEETGSFGAKSFRTAHPGGRVVIVGEPTDNRMVSASKGTKSFLVTIKGKSFHSGYPQYGESAVEKFVDFMNRLRKTEFPEDPLLGQTTWNVGKLSSDNPQNILSPELSFRLYFRTTFASDSEVCRLMESWKADDVEIEAFGGDTPMGYRILDGFETATVSFGSDAPQLSNFNDRILCGPGSILVAHTLSEYIRLSDLRQAAANYVKMFHTLVDIPARK